MAFDVYVGTFTRFYTRSWENAVQRQARIDGTHYQMIYAGGEPEPPPPASEVRAAVAAWRNGINEGFASHGHAPLDWSEDEGQPYFTDRPAWQGYSGLLLWAAYAQFPHASPPYALPEHWADDPTYLKALEEGSSLRYPTVLSASLWLPGDFRFTFEFPDIAGDDPVRVASTEGLLGQLRQLRTDELSWAKAPLFARFGKAKDAVPFKEAAVLGLDVFTALAESAVKNRLPILLSF